MVVINAPESSAILMEISLTSDVPCLNNFSIIFILLKIFLFGMGLNPEGKTHLLTKGSFKHSFYKLIELLYSSQMYKYNL